MGSKQRKTKGRELPQPPLPVLRLDDFGGRLVGYLIPAYVLMIVGGALAFRAHAAVMAGNEMSIDRAVLASVNAGTLTGFQTATGPNDYKPFGQYVMVALTVGGALLSLIIGGLAMVRILRLRFSDKQVLLAAAIAVIAAALVGEAGLQSQGRHGLTAMSQGISALGNCGVFIGPAFQIEDWQLHVILLPLIVLGGLGLTVLMELFDLAVYRRSLSTHSRTVLVWTAGLYLFFTALFLALCLPSVNWDAMEVWTHIKPLLGTCSVQAINTRTAGMPMQYAYLFPRAMQWAVILAMAVGASPGGTGGGIKTTTVAQLWAGTRRALRGQPIGRTFGIAMVWVGTYLGLAVAAVVMLMMTENKIPGDRVLFLAVSALSNVGLAHNELAVSVSGTYILCAAMLVGRMSPLLILWWMADTTRDAEVAIG